MATLNLCGGLGQRLTIKVHGYEREASQNSYDANWLRCSVEAEVGQFRGAVDASFTTQDFVHFLTELDQVMKGLAVEASFQTMEEALWVRVKIDRVGRAVVNGKLRDANVTGLSLSFTFESNISFLRQTQVELRQIVSEFPERTISSS